MQPAFEQFGAKLATFDDRLTKWGGIDKYGSITAFGIAPPRFHNQFDGPGEPWSGYIRQADARANELASELQNLIGLIKKRVPEAFDTEITAPA